MDAPAIWEEAFFEALRAKEGRISSACDFSGAARSTVYERMDRDPEFRGRVRRLQFEALQAKARERTRQTRISLGLQNT